MSTDKKKLEPNEKANEMNGTTIPLSTDYTTSENFGLVFSQYREQIYSVAYQMLGNHADADCITQDTFLRAYRAIGSFRDESSIGTWLRRIVCNLSLNRLKQDGRRKCLSIDESMQDDGMIPDFLKSKTQEPAQELVSRELRQRVHETIEDLPPDQKSAVVTVLLQGMNYADAASVLGCSKSTLAWRIFEARKTMTTRLKSFID